MYRLSNTVRDYPWGSRTAMAELFGVEPSGSPEAEMWIGAHPDSPSRVLDPHVGHAGAPDGGAANDGAPGGGASASGTPASGSPDDGGLGLDALLAQDPAHFLGADAAARFGRLPFLAKILAAGQPLSLQVHPTLAQARAGWLAEENAGVDRAAAHRNYKDDNHKPELIFALTRFTALCGFRPGTDAARAFSWLAEAVGAAADGGTAAGTVAGAAGDAARAAAAAAARRTAEQLASGDLRGAFTGLLTGGDDVVALVGLAAQAVEAAPDDAVAEPGLAELPSLAGYHPGDPGVLVSLMLNHITLEPGQAVYLPAGNIHAYLRGLGVEVMASSDNVLRGGLTGKHIDVPELVDTVDFSSLGVPYLEAEYSALGQELYRPPFEEFQLQRIALGGNGPEAAHGKALDAAPDMAAQPAAGPATDADGMAGGDVAIAQNGPVALICLAGEMLLDSPKGDVRIGRGESVFIPAQEAPVMAKRLGDGDVLAFAVTLAEAGEWAPEGT